METDLNGLEISRMIKKIDIVNDCVGEVVGNKVDQFVNTTTKAIID
jgi:3D (Asp-Asp-Asp) domain-containing protein